MAPVRLITTLALATAAAACSRPQSQTVAFYRSHPAERAARMAACGEDRGRLATGADCINALAADSEDASRRFWSHPEPASRIQTPGKL